jgi:hypothetical protein
VPVLETEAVVGPAAVRIWSLVKIILIPKKMILEPIVAKELSVVTYVPQCQEFLALLLSIFESIGMLTYPSIVQFPDLLVLCHHSRHKNLKH